MLLTSVTSRYTYSMLNALIDLRHTVVACKTLLWFCEK